MKATYILRNVWSKLNLLKRDWKTLSCLHAAGELISPQALRQGTNIITMIFNEAGALRLND
jgi:hypothetical protein